MSTTLNDGTYNVSLRLTGEEAAELDFLKSPTRMTVSGGEIKVRLEWTGPACEYLKINDDVYKLTDSAVEVPVDAIDFSMFLTPKRTEEFEPEAPTYILSFMPNTVTPIGLTPIVWTGIGMAAVVALAAIIPTVMMSVRKHKEKKLAAEAADAKNKKRSK